MTPDGLVAAIAGGIMIGLAAVLLMVLTGRIAGISGIVARLLAPADGPEWTGSLAFVVGLIAAPFVYAAASGAWPEQTVPAGLGLMIGAGLLVGFGAVYGNGCTSGHGVCGLARLSRRSLVATLVFMAAAVATVFVTRHVAGWA